jgi:hypothetical protein
MASTLFGAIGIATVLEALLRMLSYIAIIIVCFKGVQAINTYLNKNSN